MKSILKSVMSVAAAALALTSCSNDAAEEVILKGERKPLKVNATIDRTRTSLAADHVNLEWSEGDEIYLYIGEKLAEADAIPHTIGDSLTAEYKDGDIVYANYSLNNDKSKGATQAEINIKAAQTQSAPDVFAGENLPMVATGKIQNGTVNLAFKPVGHVLVFNVYGQAYNKDEKIKSITLETKEANNGFQLCDLTAETLGYEAYASNTSATVTLTTPADIAAAMPTPDTKLGNGNQVYLVVAPVAYTAATITVKTTIDPTATDNIYNTYTFTTENGIDCSQNTARVVNLNLANAAEMQPAIEVPTIPQLSSDKADGLVIENILFKNIATAVLNPADIVGVYSDPDLTAPLENSWLTITENGELFANGKLYYNVAANDTAEDRTAYIGIKCAGVQAAIAITQVAQGSTPATAQIVFEEHFDEITDGNNTTTTGSSAKWDEYSPKFSAATNVYKAGGAIKLGKSKTAGSITTGKIDLSGPITLEFKVKGWSSKKTDINISVDGEKKETVTYSAVMTDDFEQKSVQLDAATSTSTITFATTERAFIDDIVIKVTK